MMEDFQNRPADDSCKEQICWEIVESVNSIILRWDTRMRTTFVNRFALEFFGFSPGDILGRSIIGTIVPPTSMAGRDLEALMQDIIRRPEGFVNNENENVRHDGSRVWISWTNRALRDREGNVTEILSVGNDITDRKQAEEALRRQLEMTQTLLDAIPVPVFYKDTRGVYRGCNRAFADFFGMSKDRIIGRTAYDIAPPDLAEAYQKADQELFRHPGTQQYESAAVDTRGVRHDVVFFKATFMKGEGTIGGVIGTILDITERKLMWQELVRARQDLEKRVLERTEELERTNESLQREATEHRRDEAALRESEENLARAQQIAHVGIWNWDLERDILQWSDEIYKILGVTPETFKSSYGAFLNIIAPEDRDRVDRAVRASIREGKHYKEEFYVRRPDNERRYVSCEGGTIIGRDGKAVRLLGVCYDITERKQAEEALKKAKSHAELYLDLMGHDISNMNQAMMGYLEMAQELLDLKGHEELIERPLEIIRHSSRLIASVKKLEQAQSGKYPAKTVDLGPVIKEVVDDYTTVPGREIKIGYTPAEGCYVRASDMLKDVFDHLVDNAIRHSAGPLKVDIAVEPVAQDGRKYYRVSVADNGPGIPDELKRKVFRLIDEATGSPGRRGLGLYMVRTLVESYGGKVWAEDRVPGDYRQGSRFVVLLPAAEPQG